MIIFLAEFPGKKMRSNLQLNVIYRKNEACKNKVKIKIAISHELNHTKDSSCPPQTRYFLSFLVARNYVYFCLFSITYLGLSLSYDEPHILNSVSKNIYENCCVDNSRSGNCKK